MVAGGVAFCAALVWAGYQWPDLWVIGEAKPDSSATIPFIEVSKMAIAAFIGVIVTTVHRPVHHRGKSNLPVAHAQILFCVAGALMMIIIGDSLARAFGAFGIATLVRFRTALKDPKEATIMFLLIALGMAVGRGIVAVAGLGTLFVGVLLWMLDRTKEETPHDAMLELRSAGPAFPLAHVQDVLARNHLVADAREMEHGLEPMVRYHVVINGSVSPDEISRQLVDGGGHGIRSVKWELLKHKSD